MHTETQENVKGKQLVRGPLNVESAIHIAVCPVVAVERLWPGQHIGFSSVTDKSVTTNCSERIGIVDPFLREPVFPGAQFFMFLYPNTITSLRHEWTHPAFGAVAPLPLTISHDDHIDKSKAWIASHANLLGLTDDALMSDAQNWLDTGDHRVQHGSENWRNNFSSSEFWHHYEVVTGKSVPEDSAQSFYCCTC